jgi:hypothetical protein
MAVGPVIAQAPSVGLARELDTVQITGFRLSRTGAETPSPMQIITREEIVRSGAVSLTEVMQKLPANNAFTSNENDAARSHGSLCVGGVVPHRPAEAHNVSAFEHCGRQLVVRQLSRRRPLKLSVTEEKS